MLMDLETLEWDEPSCSSRWASRARCCRRSAPPARSTARRAATARRACRSPASSATSRRRCSARRASAGRSQEHLRHRLLPAGEHRRARSVRREQAAHDGRLPARRRPADVLRWRARSPSPGRWCSGCATTSADPDSARDRDAGRARSTTTAACTSCPRSPGCSRRTGAPTRAARSSGLTAIRQRRAHRAGGAGGTALQSREVVDAMRTPTRASRSSSLKVDGGMTANELLMQFQADVLGVPVVRPVVTETTALGAAYAAGLAVGFWVRRGRAARALGRGQALGAADGRRTCASTTTRSGRRRSPAPSTGSTKCSGAHH